MFASQLVLCQKCGGVLPKQAMMRCQCELMLVTKVNLLLLQFPGLHCFPDVKKCFD
jgi:hypothetical protein